jgi:hypothetical protein
MWLINRVILHVTVLKRNLKGSKKKVIYLAYMTF